MNDEERTCIICLESPLENQPLQLLTCGCRTSWFHPSCEKTWIQHIHPIDFPPKCPTCRREVDFMFQYSFRFQDGLNQKYLWWTSSIFGIEVCIASVLSLDGFHTGWILPAQTMLIVSIPFFIQSRHDLLYFLHHLRYRYFSLTVSWLIHLYKFQKLLFVYPDTTVNLLVFFGALHVLCLLIQEIGNYCSHDHYRIDPFISFVVGYDLLHKEVLPFRKTPSSTLKGNKTSRSQQRLTRI